MIYWWDRRLLDCHVYVFITKGKISQIEKINLRKVNPSERKQQEQETVDDLTFSHLFSCIDNWFRINRSCPEHPGD